MPPNPVVSRAPKLQVEVYRSGMRLRRCPASPPPPGLRRSATLDLTITTTFQRGRRRYGRTRPSKADGRFPSYRGFNPADQGDIQLIAAVMRGEQVIKGFRRQDIRRQLFKLTRNAGESPRQRARVSRLLKQLHIHGLEYTRINSPG